jgi:hypothetical protein
MVMLLPMMVRLFVGFQQCLLRGVRIGPMEGVARAHAAHREELQLHNFAAQLGHALEPIHLSFLAQFVALRHEDLSSTEPQLALPRLHIAPHRSFPDGMIRMLAAQAHPNPMSRVPLFARRFYVRGQHLVNVFLDRTQPRRFSNYRFSLGRNRVTDRLPHHPSVHAVLLG